ncbi:MAG: response regulator transcription factor [Planctomycetaceae bacterium]|nr:response regulator transcription factor [Planctomycetaceae bacterium]
MDPRLPLEATTAAQNRRFPEPSQGVIWCFIPVDVDAITSCSPGFREYFGLLRTAAHDLNYSLTDQAVLDAFGQRGVPPDSIRHLGSSATTASGREISVRIDDRMFLQVSAETVLNASGQPTGRMLTFDPVTVAPFSQETLKRLKESRARLNVLSPRESEILDLVFEGLTNKAIGLRSEISEKTVEKHRSNIMQKLGIRNSTQLIRCVCEARLGEEADRKQR